MRDWRATERLAYIRDGSRISTTVTAERSGGVLTWGDAHGSMGTDGSAAMWTGGGAVRCRWVAPSPASLGLRLMRRVR